MNNNKIYISKLGLGCWSFGGGEYWGPMKQSVVNNIVRRAFELGINYYDTAEVYNEGKSELALGIALNCIRNKVLIGSKISPKNADPKHAVTFLEKSLKRLKTDHIDIFMLHWPINYRSILHYTKGSNKLNYKYNINDVFEEFEKIKKEGKIINYGVSNFGKKQLNEISKEFKPIVNELPYNKLSRAIEYDILEECDQKGIKVIGYMPLLQGLLSGKYQNLKSFPKNRARTRHFDSRHNQKSRTGENGFELETTNLLKKLNQISCNYNVPLNVLALKWCQNNVNCTIVGARSVSHLEDNLSFKNLILSKTKYDKINQISEDLKRLLGNNPDLYEGKNNQRIF